jgi:hypothetical protein
MFARRIVACACALAVAVPAAASARPGFDPPVAGPAVAGTGGVTYGDTKSDLQNKQDLGAPSLKGDTKADVAPPAGNSVEAIMSLSDGQLAAAYGGTGQLHTAKVSNPVTGSTDDGTDGWRIAAVAEAALLAAIALGAAALVGRARPRRGATA